MIRLANLCTNGDGNRCGGDGRKSVQSAMWTDVKNKESVGT